MIEEQFQQFVAAGFSHIPVFKTQLADMETPLSVFAKLREQHCAYLFESVEGGQRWGRYSMIGLGTPKILEYSDGVMRVGDDGHVEETPCADPFAYIRQFMQQYNMPDKSTIAGLPGFTGGLVGYFAYDTVRYIEPKLGKCKNPDTIGLPDIWLMVSDTVVVFDKLADTISIVVYANAADKHSYALATLRIAAIEDLLKQPVVLADAAYPMPAFSSHSGQAQYEASVLKVQEYIKAGDVMQVVPSQRMTADFAGDALSVYRAIRHINPSPYLFLLDVKTLKDNKPFQLVGSSPEILSRLENGVVTVRPLAGTRARGKTAEEDARLAAELLADSKEIAEHLMLIDLGRNDVGRVSEVGKVAVTEHMQIERYSQVMHIVSNVEGQVKAGIDALDVFKATFPAGTLSGAPKIRAMQIIDEIEPVKRGVFGGCVGYLGWDGSMDTAIAIRTAVFRDGKVHVQAGAGVVADSVPSSEWQETLMKARAMIKAVEMSANGMKID